MALNDVPLSGQSLNDTRNPIRTNFVTIDQAFLVDHVTYNSAGQGKHNRVTLPEQVAGGGAATLANEALLYSGQGTTSAVTELFFKRENLAIGVAGTPFTESILSTSAPMADTDGWTYLPSGILIKWGLRNATAGGSTYDLNTGGTLGPNFNQIIHVQIAAQVTASNLRVQIIATNQIRLAADAIAATYFLAIGR